MLKFVVAIAFVSSFTFSSVSAETCSYDASRLFEGINFVVMDDKCVTRAEEQIKKVLLASLQYLKMASHFHRNAVNRPGFAKFFFEVARDKRDHAHKLIQYLSLRGRYMKGPSRSSLMTFDITGVMKNAEKDLGFSFKFKDLVDDYENKRTAGLNALTNALTMEVELTKSVGNLIKTCEDSSGVNDFHFVKYLSSEMLDDQYELQRDLAGKISTLGQMVGKEAASLADFVFDKQLL